MIGYPLEIDWNLHHQNLKSKVNNKNDMAAHAKGQTISEWIYEVIISPKIWTKNCQEFCPV